FGTTPQCGLRVEEVADLGAREIGVEREAGPGAEERFVPVGPELVADRRADPALPDDRVGHRSPSGAIPDDRRLALVRDPDRGDPIHAAHLLDDLASDAQLALPDRLRVVRNVAGRRVALLELALGGRDRPARM